jgi:hypothetical protein
VSSNWRTVRLYLSATYGDMHAERDHLVKVVFPALREQLRPFRVELIDVDLRWDVSREQAENERGVLLCLDQIDECRPFFLGLIGSRYGWSPAAYPEELRKRFPWVPSGPPRSLTELEMFHGALNDTAWMTRALFCFRNEAVNDTIPEDYRTTYVEANPAVARKSADLRKRIAACGYPVEHYQARWDSGAYDRAAHSFGRLVDLDAFGECVRNWLWFAIRAQLKLLTPPKPGADLLAEEIDFHERFREQRRAHYAGRSALLRQLHTYAQSDDSVPLLLTGPPGCGKSAALAHFVRTFRLQHPKAIVLGHFLGATPRSVLLREMLGRLVGELKEALRLNFAIPTGTPERLSLFLGMLDNLKDKHRLVLVLDGLDQLAPDNDTHTLHWLPENLKPHVKLLASCTGQVETLPSHSGAAGWSAEAHPMLAAFRARGGRLLTVEPLSEDDRRLIIRSTPRLPPRTLEPTAIVALARNPAAGNPLFLTVALDELRGGGLAEPPEERIARFPRGAGDADSLAELYEQVLLRLEEEFGIELVRLTLTLLTCARRGLSEQELRDLTADSQYAVELQPLLRNLRPHLWNRGGQLEIVHASLRRVVRLRYLQAPEDMLAGKSASVQRSPAELVVRHRIGSYFGNRVLDERQLEEVPYQMAEMHAWPELVGVLSNLPLVAALWQQGSAGESDVKGYWARVRAGSVLRMPDTYRPVLEQPARHHEYVPMVALLLQSAGHLEEALRLREYQGECCRRAGDQAKLAASLASQAALRIARNDLVGALPVLQEQEKIGRALDDRAALKTCLSNQALVQRRQGNLEGAMRLHREEEFLCRQMNNHHGVALSMINQAHLLADKMKQPVAALPLAEEAFRLATRHGFTILAGQIKTRLARIRKQATQPEQPGSDSQVDPSSRFLKDPPTSASGMP